LTSVFQLGASLADDGVFEPTLCSCLPPEDREGTGADFALGSERVFQHSHIRVVT